MKKQSVVFYAMWIFLLLTVSMQNVLSQNQGSRVAGIVTDSSGEPIPGVNILQKGTDGGTITDVDGEFSLNVENPEEAVLSFSFIGFKSMEVAVEGRTQLEIMMEEEVLGLDEVVVIGYGSVKKSDLTGSVASVQVEDLNETPANSVERLLQGRSAGLQVINSSQDPGAGSDIRIRGGSSMEGSNAPLVVVDGFPLGDAGDLKQINPQDITSIEVMKDASASAIYGSRGANGVIMVTTRRAKEGTTQVNVTQQTTLSRFDSELMRWDDPLLMAILANEEQRNAGLLIPYRGETNSVGVYHPSLYEIASGEWPHNTDWKDVVFRDMPITSNTSVSVGSANEKTSFNLSLNFLDEKGVFIEDDFKKGIVNLAVDHEFSDFFSVSTSNIFSRNVRNRNQNLEYWRNPLWPVYNEDGTYFMSSSRDYGHPIAKTENVLDKTNGLDYIGSYQFDFQLHETLKLTSQVNYKHGSTITDRYNPKKYTEEGVFRGGGAHIENWQDERFSNETFATWENQYGIHDISVMGGGSYENHVIKTSNLRAFDFVSEALGNENMSAGNPETNEVSNNLEKREMVSFYGRVKYKLLDKYLFTGTYRMDGSSVFGENNKWAYFPSMAVSWNAHHEQFVKDLNVFDQLKFRASYGVSGNQAIGTYQTLARYGVENYYDNGAWRTAIGPGYVAGYYGADDRYREWRGIPNKSLKWETTEQYNYGVDMAFFDHRLSVGMDYYNKNTDDLLYTRVLPPSSSYDRMWVNGGQIKNEGFEVTIDGDIIRQQDWKLSGTFIYSQNKNEVVSLGDSDVANNPIDPMTGTEYRFTGYEFTQFRQAANVFMVGEAFNVFYGYETDGIIQTEAEGLAAGLEGYLAEPGEFKYVDLNDDGEITTADRTIIGDPNPDFTASLALDFSYKRFDLSVFFNGVFGNDILYQDKLNQADVRPLRWTPDNPTNDYPRLYSGRQLRLSDWFIEDGSFVRIQNMTLGYNFNTEAVGFLSNLRLYVNASNLHTFTNFSGYDPEVGLDGIYWGGYPRLTQYTLGLNLTF
jgi:TonB-linked SusC/RagA family outer membrane protein